MKQRHLDISAPINTPLSTSAPVKNVATAETVAPINMTTVICSEESTKTVAVTVTAATAVTTVPAATITEAATPSKPVASIWSRLWAGLAKTTRLFK
jgi:hypothetical protein